MRNKKVLLVGIIATLMLAGTVAAGDYIIEDNTGSDLLVLGVTTGNLNVTTGKIAEGGTLLEQLYCSLTGCSVTDLAVTSVFNATGAAVYFDDDSINESIISFDTVCPVGSSLYVSGGDLACQVNPVDTKWTINTRDFINNSNTLELNWTTINATIDDRVIADTDTKWTLDDVYLNNVSDVATFNETKLNETINDFLSSDGYVQKSGDTMTGVLNMSNTVINLDGSNITRLGTGTTATIDASGNFIITLDP